MGLPTPAPFLVRCAYLGYLILQLSSLSFGGGGNSTLGGGEEWYFDYDEDSPFGPQHWGDLHQEWATCKDGKAQSPINLTYVEWDPRLVSLKANYDRAYAVMLNTGHSLQVDWTRSMNKCAGLALLDNKYYCLEQCHWHSPAEHTLRGIRYPLEMHMVHKSNDGSIAVVAIFYQYGEPDPFLLKLQKYLQTTNETSIGLLDPPEGHWWDAAYFTYPGSLTTPPCTEGVTWILIPEVRTVSIKQVQMLRAAMHHKDNARPIQPTNQRPVRQFSGSPTSQSI